MINRDNKAIHDMSLGIFKLVLSWNSLKTGYNEEVQICKLLKCPKHT